MPHRKREGRTVSNSRPSSANRAASRSPIDLISLAATSADEVTLGRALAGRREL
jgi:hypothetical protein